MMEQGPGKKVANTNIIHLSQIFCFLELEIKSGSVAEPEPHHFGGAGASPFWWSRSLTILVEPEPHHFGGAGALTERGSGSKGSGYKMYNIRGVSVNKVDSSCYL
jgi:hypothetical protein